MFPLVGLTSEYQRLVTSVKKRQPLLMLGPGGSGKSALISAVLKNGPPPDGAISVPYSSNLHRLLVNLAKSLMKSNHGAFGEIAKLRGDCEQQLERQTSLHLKGILWNALEAEPRVIVLDGVTGASFPIYRFLQRLYFTRDMAVLAAARDAMALGALARLFWDPRHAIRVEPLHPAEANRLFDLAVERFEIGNLDIKEFRSKAIDAAKGNPGQLIEMCKLAKNPIYVMGKHIKFAPLRIDALTKFL